MNKLFRNISVLLIFFILIGCENQLEVNQPSNANKGDNVLLKGNDDEGLGGDSFLTEITSQLQPGDDLFVRGKGLYEQEGGDVVIEAGDLPDGATVKYVLAYMTAAYEDEDLVAFEGAPETTTIDVGTNSDVEFELIGQGNYYNNTAYRADITSMVTIEANAQTTIPFSNFAFNKEGNNTLWGVAVVVIFNNPANFAKKVFDIRDGADYVWRNEWREEDRPYATQSVRQFYNVGVSTLERKATFYYIVGEAEDPDRPDHIEIYLDGQLAIEHYDDMNSNVGLELDVVAIDFKIPPGVSEVSTELFSDPRPADEWKPDQKWDDAESFVWIYNSLTVESFVFNGCTRTIGYWKTHGYEAKGNNSDMIKPILDQYEVKLGEWKVENSEMAVDILSQKVYGSPSNGITKLYAQLLAAKLNILSGAEDFDVAQIILDADEFLELYSYTDWDNLSDELQNDVSGWHSMLDNYNNGLIGPEHCGDSNEIEVETAPAPQQPAPEPEPQNEQPKKPKKDKKSKKK